MALIEEDLRQPRPNSAIVDRVVAAVMEQKLAAGAKLPEAPLGEAFDCSRTQIRQVLIVLAERGVVTLHPNRGAFMRQPRRGGSAQRVRGAAGDRALDRARGRGADRCGDARRIAAANARADGAAEARGDRSENRSRLSGQFHLRLAEAAGNAVLTKFLEELRPRAPR